MELDDLRRQWQRPEPVDPVALTSTELQALVAGQRGGLIEKMRRNTYWEAVVGLGIIAPCLIISMLMSHKTLSALYAGAMAVLAVVLAYYYYRVLATLRRLTKTTGSVRGHLERLYSGLRQLLRFYYRLSLATGPVLLTLIFCFMLGKELLRPAGFRPSLMVALGIALLAFGAVLQVAVVYGTRWWVQRFYGQHLDRLEGQLRELEEPATT